MECVPEDAVAIIRQRSRHNDQVLRRKKRSMVRDTHRFNLASIAKDLQIPSVYEVSKLSAQLKKKKDPETLRKLRLGLSVGGESVTAFLNTEDVLHHLISCLTGNNADLKREAICTLVNVALGTEEQCYKVYQAVGVYIMFLMSGKPIELQDPCAWCIGNLCGGHKSVCQQVQTSGILERLRTLMRSRVPHIFQSAAYALTQVFATDPEKMKTMDIQNIVRMAMDGIENFDEAIPEASWLLFVMSEYDLVCEYLLCQGFIHTALWTLMKIVNQQSLDVSSATAIVRVLLNCVGAFPKSAIQVCNRSEQFVSVSTALLYSPHPHLRAETLQMVANVMNGAAQSLSGQCAVDDLNLRPRLDVAVRSALAANFTSDSPTLSTNFDGAVCEFLPSH